MAPTAASLPRASTAFSRTCQKLSWVASTRDCSAGPTGWANETCATQPRPKNPWGELSGYDRIALHTVQGIHFNSNAIIPLNVDNRGNLPELDDADVVEVPCVVDKNGVQPTHIGTLPPQPGRRLVVDLDQDHRAVDAVVEHRVRGAVADPAKPGVRYVRLDFRHPQLRMAIRHVVHILGDDLREQLHQYVVDRHVVDGGVAAGVVADLDVAEAVVGEVGLEDLDGDVPGTRVEPAEQREP